MNPTLNQRRDIWRKKRVNVIRLILKYENLIEIRDCRFICRNEIDCALFRVRFILKHLNLDEKIMDATIRILSSFFWMERGFIIFLFKSW